MNTIFVCFSQLGGSGAQLQCLHRSKSQSGQEEEAPCMVLCCAVLSYSMMCYPMLFSAVLCCAFAMLFCAVCFAVLCNLVLSYALLCRLSAALLGWGRVVNAPATWGGCLHERSSIGGKCMPVCMYVSVYTWLHVDIYDSCVCINL